MGDRGSCDPTVHPLFPNRASKGTWVKKSSKIVPRDRPRMGICVHLVIGAYSNVGTVTSHKQRIVHGYNGMKMMKRAFNHVTSCHIALLKKKVLAENMIPFQEDEPAAPTCHP